MDPYVINEKTLELWPMKTENNIYKFLVQQYFKEYILLPYNTIFHWVLFVIEITKGQIIIMDSMHKDRDVFDDIIDMINRCGQDSMQMSAGNSRKNCQCG